MVCARVRKRLWNWLEVVEFAQECSKAAQECRICARLSKGCARVQNLRKSRENWRGSCRRWAVFNDRDQVFANFAVTVDDIARPQDNDAGPVRLTTTTTTAKTLARYVDSDAGPVQRQRRWPGTSDNDDRKASDSDVARYIGQSLPTCCAISAEPRKKPGRGQRQRLRKGLSGPVERLLSCRQ